MSNMYACMCGNCEKEMDSTECDECTEASQVFWIELELGRYNMEHIDNLIDTFETQGFKVKHEKVDIDHSMAEHALVFYVDGAKAIERLVDLGCLLSLEGFEATDWKDITKERNSYED